MNDDIRVMYRIKQMFKICRWGAHKLQSFPNYSLWFSWRKVWSLRAIAVYNNQNHRRSINV